MSKFKQQKARATAKRLNTIFKQNQQPLPKFHEESYEETLRNPDFDSFVQDGYKKGYTIRTNPRTGKKEMFVAGSRSIGDWVLNAVDAGLYGVENLVSPLVDEVWEEGTSLPAESRPHLDKLDVFRQYGQWRLGRIARREDVDVVYGHSRGGAMVADMNVGTADKVGVDSAMWIAREKDMVNFNEGGEWLHPTSYFDLALGVTGKKNVTLNYGSKVHHAWN